MRDLPALTVACVRVFDPYREGAAEAAFRHLLAWAEQRGLADRQWLGYMWDEPEIVAMAGCRSRNSRRHPPRSARARLALQSLATSQRLCAGRLEAIDRRVIRQRKRPSPSSSEQAGLHRWRPRADRQHDLVVLRREPVPGHECHTKRSRFVAGILSLNLALQDQLR